MPRQRQSDDEARLHRLQTGAAIGLGFALLLLILLRAHHGNVLPAGWWKP